MPFDQNDLDAIGLLKSRIMGLIPHNENGYFLRMSGHSPKDVPKPLRVFNVDDMIDLVVRSERVLLDLEFISQFWYPGKSLNFILLPWIVIESFLEFRCFVKLKKLNCISQYNFTESFEQLLNEEFIKK